MVKLVDAPRSATPKAKGSPGKKAAGTAKKMVVSETPKAKTKKPAVTKKTAQKKATTGSAKDTVKKGTAVKSAAKKSQQVDSDGAFSLALNKIKKKVDEQRRQEEIKRIREKIADGESGEGDGAGDGSAATGSGGIPSGQGKLAALPLNYRLYYQAIEEKIKGNWNLALPRGVIEDMSAMEVVLSITIKSDGHITDISFEKKSGNVYLDESAFRSIKKSSPLPPFSEYNIREPFFETGIIFPAGELL
jgi:TonB family protein